MNTLPAPQPVADALRALIARADALPGGDAERYVQACTHELATACTRGDGIRPAVDRLVSAIKQLQGALTDGPRRRAERDGPAVERLLETFQEQLLTELRRQSLL